LTKEGDGSKSAYIAHIGGFFSFVALAGLSLIGWGLNHHCWSKKSCCFKEYHNPLNIRVFWWISFMSLCGVFACCISGFVTSTNFSNKVETTKCVYQRVYYDSIFGEINKDNKDKKKKNIPWEGLEKKDEKKRRNIIGEFEDFLNKDYEKFDFNFDDKWIKGNEWIEEEEENEKLGSLLENEFHYTMEFKNSLNDILHKCQYHYEDFNQSLIDINGELICDSFFESNNSFVYRYFKEINRMIKYFFDEAKQIQDFITENEQKEKRQKSYEKQLNIADNILSNISDGFNIYKNGFLNDAYDYINIYNVCGYILVTIFYSILLVIVICSCFLLWAYSYFKEQRIIYTFMHVVWNILKFFSFLFFIFGAAFGASYLVSRDLIGYNKFLFSDLNLASNATTYLLPNGTTKEFLRYCINEKDSNYINKFDIPTIQKLKDLYYNRKIGKEINEHYDWSDLKKEKVCYYIINENLRNIEEKEEDSDDSSDQSDKTITLDFTGVGEAVRKMINEYHNKLFNEESSPVLRLFQEEKSEGKTKIIPELKALSEAIDKLNCGYLKTEMQILYDTLYELSIESRISCALCCCIGFFIELSIAFYLLVLYHYNNIEFRDDNDSQRSFPKNRNRKFDLDSQNEFMDKSRPPNLKKNNKKLDLEFNFN